MVRRKMELTKKDSDFPYTPEGLIENLNKGPLPDLYNVIYLTIKDTCKKKSSLPLPPDLNPCTQAILNAHHQAFVSRRCLEKDIEPIDFADNGWKMDKDDLVVPVWFTCSQLPPSVTKKSKNGRGQRQRKPLYDADAETEVYEPPKKTIQKSRIARELRVNEVYESPMKHLQQNKVSREIKGTSYDADNEDAFPESTTEEDADDFVLNEWERESKFESTDSDSSDSDWDP